MTAQLPFNGGALLILDNGEAVEVYMQEDISGLGQSFNAAYRDSFGNTIIWMIEDPRPASDWAADMAGVGGMGNWMHHIKDKVQATFDNHFVYGPGRPVTNAEPYEIQRFNLALKQYSRIKAPAQGITGPVTWELLA